MLRAFWFFMGAAVALAHMALYYRVLDWFALAWVPLIIAMVCLRIGVETPSS